MMFRKCHCFLTRRLDPYSILGIPVTATKEEIRKAYHRQALRYHPDSGKEGSSAKFNAIREAYEALKDGKASRPNVIKRESTTGYTYETPGSTDEAYVIVVLLTVHTMTKKERLNEVPFDKIPFESVHQGDE